MRSVKRKPSGKTRPPHPRRKDPRHHRYEILKNRIRKLGYICQGSITERWLRCGKSSCVCRRDLRKRHGPYLYWTRKVSGRTQTRLLDARLLPLYREAMADNRRLEDIIEQMRDISLQALDAFKIAPKA